MYALYIDDSILGAPTRKELDAAIKAIQDAKLHITFKGDLTDFLRVKIEQKSTNEIIFTQPHLIDRIPSTTPGAEPPRDTRDSGSARSHSTHLETSSSDRPKWSPTRSSTRYQDQISVKCTRRTLRMPSFTRAAHAQPSLSNFPRRDSNFGERTRSRGTTLGERNFPTSPQNKKTKLTHCSIYVPMRTISTSHAK